MNANAPGSNGNPNPPPMKSPVVWVAGAVILLLGLAAFVGPYIPGWVHPKSEYARCAELHLVGKVTDDVKAAVKVGESLGKLAEGGGAFTVTRDNVTTTEARAVTDDTVREGLRNCLASSGHALPATHATATVRVKTSAGRDPDNVDVQLKGNAAQRCRTENGECNLTLFDATAKSFKLIAKAKRFIEVEEDVSREDFVKGVTFTVKPPPTFTVLVTRDGQAAKAVDITVDAGEDFPIWSAACQETDRDDGCHVQTTDHKGEAKFYRSKPFQSLRLFVGDLDIVVDDPASLGAIYPLKLRSATSPTNTPPREVEACPKSALDALSNALRATSSAGDVHARVSAKGTVVVTKGDDAAKSALTGARVPAPGKECLAKLKR